MTVSEAIKFQAKILEWQAKKVAIMCLKCKYQPEKGGVWLTDGKVIARIANDLFILRVTDDKNISKYISLPENAVQAWQDTACFKDKELGMCIHFENTGADMWVCEKYLKLFGKGEHSFYLCDGQKCLWLTEPNTRNVLGVIAGVRIGGVQKIG